MNIDNKHQCTFIKLDIKGFYPSITEDILEKSLEFAKQYVDIIEKDIRKEIIVENHCYFLTMNYGKKKSTAICFDVTTGYTTVTKLDSITVKYFM